jgi:4-hydroxy-2-oxoheptanedioate aldolase
MDFVILDTEHGPLSIERCEDLCRAADSVGVAPIIRVGENHPWLILRALDIGSAGVQVPQINDVESARAAVHSAKYAPQGERGLSIFTRAGDYHVKGGEGYTERANAETVVIVHIEGKRGLDNLDQILKVEGIDVFFLGPYDISQSLGVPGRVDHPRVQEAMREAAKKARSLGKAVGSYARDVAMARQLMEMGVQYLSILVDATIYLYACREIVRQLRK